MMKKLFFTLTVAACTLYSAQTVSCNDLVNYAKSEDRYPDTVNPFNSSMLAKVEYYQVNNGGLVLAYIKENDYDFRGKPYIFCGISTQRWSKFKSEGLYGSWGKAFHAYIRDYTCDCN